MNVPTINNTEVYKQVISSRLGFHPVEVINNEVISAGFAPTAVGGQAQVLLHCRVEPNGQLTFTVKTSDPGILMQLEASHLPSIAN